MTDNLTQNNVNAALLNRDYTLMLDRSGSMDEPVKAGSGTSRWTAAEEGTTALARKLGEFDPDGITVYAFANHFKRYDNVTVDKVKGLFRTEQPNGGTHLVEAFGDAVENYFTRKKSGKAQPNGESFFIVTDGRTEDEAGLVQLIKKTTMRIDNAKELSITFVQIGDDTHARDYLKRLDDDLEAEGAKYDIVDVITMDDMGGKSLTQVLTDAILEHKQGAA